jgi:hypothetical protein
VAVALVVHLVIPLQQQRVLTALIVQYWESYQLAAVLALVNKIQDTVVVALAVAVAVILVVMVLVLLVKDLLALVLKPTVVVAAAAVHHKLAKVLMVAMAQLG